MTRSARLPAVTAFLALATIALMSGPTQAADAQEGYRLANLWCTTCHIIAPGQAGSDAARPFVSIAKDLNFSEDGIRAWLSDPHPPMPNLNLDREEIDRIIAYLQSLR